MKKCFTIIVFGLLCGILNLSAQMVDRQLVLMEKVTGIKCPTCPAAANGMNQMLAEGLKIAAVNYHWIAFDKIFNNEIGEQRITYYFPDNPYNMAAPTAIFDGTTKNTASGGSSVSTYNKYMPDYETAIAVKSPMYIEITSTEMTANLEWEVKITVTKKDLSFSASNIVLQTILTESNIPYSWGGGIETVEHTERNMYPDANGVVVTFNADNKFTYTATVQMKEDWKFYNCDIVAFVQDNDTKTVYQANQIRLSDKVTAMPTNVKLSTNPCSMDVSVTWTDGEFKNVSLLGYNVYDGKNKINTNIIEGNSYLVKNQKIGNRCISVAAVYDLAESPKTYEECIFVDYPAGVTNLTGTVNSNDVTLNWTRPIDTNDGEVCATALLGYNVYRNSERVNKNPITETAFIDVVTSVGEYMYYVTAQYESAESFRSNIVPIEVTTVGVENIALSNIRVYPNPVSASGNYELRIENDGKEFNCIITDIAGKEILKTKETNIDMSLLRDGMYIVIIKTTDGDKAFKIIKRK